MGNLHYVAILGILFSLGHCQFPGMGEMAFGRMGEMAMLSNMLGGGSGHQGGNNMMEMAALSTMMGGESLASMMPVDGSRLAQMAMMANMFGSAPKSGSILRAASNPGSLPDHVPAKEPVHEHTPAPAAAGAAVPAHVFVPARGPSGVVTSSAPNQPTLSLMMAMINAMGKSSMPAGMNQMLPSKKMMDLTREGLGVNPMLSKMVCPPRRCPFPSPCENPHTLFSASTFYVCPDCPKCPAEIMQSVFRQVSAKLARLGVPRPMTNILSQQMVKKNMERLTPV